MTALMYPKPVATASDPIRLPAAGIGPWPAWNASGVITRVDIGLGLAANASGLVTYIPPARTPDRFTDYELYNLSDWDGYGAQPISGETVESARRFFLQIPRRFNYVDIAPGSDGTIGFEWRFERGSICSFVLIDVGPGELVSARKIDPSGKITTFPPAQVGSATESLLSQLFCHQFL